MKTPVIAINFKTYATGVGYDALHLATICDEVANETQKSILVCVPATDIYKVQENVSIPVYGEHVDGVEFGSHTGKIMAVDLKENGAEGSLINHSEDQYETEAIKQAIIACRAEQITSIVCANTPERAEEIAHFEPDSIAYEPPELIGGDISVTTKPEIIEEVVKRIKAVNPNIQILVGAGVKTAIDVEKAIELGCDGVLLASGVTKAEDPKAALLDLALGVK